MGHSAQRADSQVSGRETQLCKVGSDQVGVCTNRLRAHGREATPSVAFATRIHTHIAAAAGVLPADAHMPA